LILVQLSDTLRYDNRELTMVKYKVIKGTFHVKGYEPDGDSIRFRADNEANWDWSGFAWSEAKSKSAKKKQLRFEGIDALETHYENAKQPPAFAIAALERMLELVGITEVEYNLMVTTIISAKDSIPGWIVSSAVDMFDRPISFVFPSATKLLDGSELALQKIPLKESINYKLAEEGIVYPTFYSPMEPELIDVFRKVFVKTKKKRMGLWAVDRSAGFRLWNVNTIQQDVIIMPKLFRRLIAFFNNDGDITAFKEYLKNHSDPIIAPGGEKSLGEIVEINGNRYGLKYSPEEIVFQPKG
jgi:endonuclease YncB( thermonuclease family)